MITLHNYSYPWWWQRLVGRKSQAAPKPVRSFVFRIFSLSPGAAAHADVAVVLYKALMTCKGITTWFGRKASTGCYGCL